jgi:hypothetical protein
MSNKHTREDRKHEQTYRVTTEADRIYLLWALDTLARRRAA